MRHPRMVIFFLIIVSAGSVGLFAGRNITPPVSFSNDVLPEDNLDNRVLAPPDTDKLLAEDRGRPVPLRVAVPSPVFFTPVNSGTWEFLPDGSDLWRLRITSPGAVFMSLKISDYQLPRGAQLHVYSVDREFHDGPYTYLNNNDSDRLGIPMIAGDSIVVELHLQPRVELPVFVIDSVSHGYKDAMGMASVPYRGEWTEPRSDPDPLAPPFACQRDVNCPEGAPYQNEKHSISEGYDGVYICSGTLLNNIREDCPNYYITANHCEWFLDPAGMTYYWDYENSTCGGSDAPWNTSSGSWTRFEGNATDDITLMELYDNLDVHGVYYTGWTRDPSPSTESAVLSFPSDKPMQVCIDTDTLIDCEATPALCPDGWGPQYWRIDSYEVGVTEGGSSGGGLMNQDHLIVGVLSGGVGTSCNDFEWDEYAKVYDSMNKGLDVYLDPDGTGLIQVPGKFMESCDCPMTIEITPDPAWACLGDPLTLTANLTGGTSPYTYQWTQDGFNIPGATNSTYTTSYATSQSHLFNCRVSDSSGACIENIDYPYITGQWVDCVPVIEFYSDSNYTEITGDGDTSFEPGEQWSVDITLKNNGYGVANNVTAVLEDDRGAALVCIPMGDFGTIPVGGTSTVNFEFVIAQDFEAMFGCGATLDFDITTKTSLELTPAGPDEIDAFSFNVGEGGPFIMDYTYSGSTVIVFDTTTDFVLAVPDSGSILNVLTDLSLTPPSGGVVPTMDVSLLSPLGTTGTIYSGDPAGWSDGSWSVPDDYDGEEINGSWILRIVYDRGGGGPTGTDGVLNDWQLHVTLPGPWDCSDIGSGDCGGCGAMTVDVTPDGETVTCAWNDLLYAATPTDGAPPYTYQWTEDGIDIPGATDSTYTASYGSAQSHDYNCKISDSAGCDNVTDPSDSVGTWTDILFADVTPDGTTVVFPGMDIVFLVTPSGGTPPYSYQWTEDGLDIAGATDQTLTMNYGTPQIHFYNCRVSGSGDCMAEIDPVDSTGEWIGSVTPPVADGVTGDGIWITKVSGTTLHVDYDIFTCASDHTVILYGNLGSFGAYAGAVDSGCDTGLTGGADFDIVADNVWFNLLWVNSIGTAGHPGFGTAGNRTLNATGFCGVTMDDHFDTVCD